MYSAFIFNQLSFLHSQTCDLILVSNEKLTFILAYIKQADFSAGPIAVYLIRFAVGLDMVGLSWR